ncbi:hypothetical protein D3C78_910610 [compost metagenome]
MRTAEETGNIVTRILAALMSDYSNRHTVQLRKAAHDSQVISKQPVTVKLKKVCKYRLNKIKRGRALMMTRHVHLLCRCELAVQLVLQLLAL